MRKHIKKNVEGKICFLDENYCEETVFWFHIKNNCLHIDSNFTFKRELGVENYKYGITIRGYCSISSDKVVFESSIFPSVILQFFARHLKNGLQGKCVIVLKKKRGFSLAFEKRVCYLLSESLR